ncbi:uncharacterized protein LOC127797539 [Diospyros lotus]|uniref:uncharacterized protein LOC127797539 n=1 Tax=Diospyros lotus TaxID=55363 RepID=UPI00224CEFB4|nr:uncharacterized protein LOC127797539 [Diospyros lotus]
MDSLSSVSSSIVLPPSNSHFRCRHRHRHRRRLISVAAQPVHPSRLSSFLSSFLTSVPRSPDPCGRRFALEISCKSAGGGPDDDDGEGEGKYGRDEEVERALRLDGTIPGTSNEFVERVSSRAYDMRRNLQQTFDSSSYDVLENNPWRETSKPVYVLTQRENQLCTMKTRRNRSEVERELGLLFSKGGKWRSGIANQSKQSRPHTKFQMLVEDIREGVLVFEDENEAARYCNLLEGGGQGCEGVAEIEASSVFDLCQKMRALAVLFRRGRTPPQPESLMLNLRARKRSLEDQED